MGLPVLMFCVEQIKDKANTGQDNALELMVKYPDDSNEYDLICEIDRQLGEIKKSAEGILYTLKRLSNP